MKISTLKSKTVKVISIISLLVLWQLASNLVNNEVIIPSIKATVINIGEFAGDKEFYITLISTVLRSIISFFIAFIFSLFLGILSGLIKEIEIILNPIINFVKSVPTMGIIILALIWLNSDKAPILIGFMISFPILYGAVLEAIKSIDKNLIEMSNLYKVRLKFKIKDIYIPAMYSYLFSVIPTTLSLNLKVVIGGEVLGQPNHAIGTSMQLEKLYLNTSGVFAWIIIVVVLSGIIEFMVKCIYKSIVKWK